MSHAARRPQRLPTAQAQLLTDMADVLGIEELVLYGGGALDLLVEPTQPTHDLDVAITGISHLQPCLPRLAAHPAIAAVSAPRQYWIRFDQPVVMIDVEWRGKVIDLNFVETLDGIGHFDVECVAWHHPSATYTDPHGVLDSPPVRDVRLVSGVSSENPLLLLNRAVKLAAKYGVDLEGPGHLASAIPALTAAARRWASTDDFHGRQALHAHTRALASATQRAAHPAHLLHQCLRTGVIDCRHPALGEALRRDGQAVHRLAAARSYDEFWRVAAGLVRVSSRRESTHSGGTR